MPSNRQQHRIFSYAFFLPFLVVLLFIVPGVTYAAPWPGGGDHAGSWSAEMKHSSKILKSADLVLWDDEAGNIVGLARMKTSDGECLGHLSVDKTTGYLNIESIDSEVCANIDRSYFLVSYLIGNNFLVTWFPANNSGEPLSIRSKTLIAHTNSALFLRNKAIPTYLKPLITKHGGKHHFHEGRVMNEADPHDKVIEDLKVSLKERTLTQFPDAELMGVWQGQFIDRKTQYPVEIALWSAKIYRIQKIVGLISFNDQQCFSGLFISPQPRGTILYLDSSYIKGENSYGSCALKKQEGFIQLSPDFKSLQIYYTESLIGERNKCFNDLPREGCYTAGVFHRAAPSATFIERIEKTSWAVLTPPPVDVWEALRDNVPISQPEKNKHIAAAALNESEREKKRAESARAIEEDRKRYREESARYQAIIKRHEEKTSASGRAHTRAQSNPVFETVSGPFNGIDGANFLNAIYLGDYASMERQTTAYQRLRVKQRSDFMGGQPHWTDGIQNAAIQSVRLISTVHAIYLFNYQTYYASCLADDAVEFIVTETTPDIVTSNILGVEVSRAYGSVNQTAYKINPEFTSIFRRVGKTKPEGAMASLADMLLSGGKPDLRRQLIAGVRQMMQKFDCDSTEIQQFERNMLNAN